MRRIEPYTGTPLPRIGWRSHEWSLHVLAGQAVVMVRARLVDHGLAVLEHGHLAFRAAVMSLSV